MSKIVKFPSGHRFFGYGFDVSKNLVVSYKRDSNGRYLEKRTSYVFYYRTVYHESVRQDAATIYTKAQSVVVASNKFVAAALAVAPAGSFQGLENIKPNFPYVLYSVKNQASQYFFAGTSLVEALARLAKRGEYVNAEDVRILNTVTEKVSKLTPQKVVTYTLG